METIQCLQNKKDILIIGDRESKRTVYFSKAGKELGYNVKCIDWKMMRKIDIASSIFIKLDPPNKIGIYLEDLENFIKWYFEELKHLSSKKIICSNYPIAIWQTLDKVLSKNILMKNGIDITPMIDINANSYEDLLEKLIKKNEKNIFIKPRYGSGAAGVIAYRYNSRTYKEALYTSLKISKDGRLYNTKAVSKFTNKEMIKEIIDKLLQMPVIIERWIQKSQYNGLSYDLRVVYQYGKIDYIVARGSKNPITNLHLNNCAISIEDLDLKEYQIKEIEEICKKTVNCFEGLNIAGIDVLMTPSGKFNIIEVNGQGDLIYQDIFNENIIYKRQIVEGVK